MLDADFGMGMGTDMARMLALGFEVQEAILVGIGYGSVSVEEWGQLRTIDLTPSADLGYEGTLREQNPAAPEVLSGEASAFLRFLVEEVRPFVESRYRVSEEGRGIFGDSLGGLFCLFTLFHAPESFDRYIIGSPSIWWDEKVTLEFEEAYAANHADLPAEVFMSVGLLEEDPNEPLSASSAMVTNTRNLEATLLDRAYPNLHLTTHFFEGETHLSVIPSNMGWGLRTLYPAGG
jgi:predicted alpha/beta superfamily hydrolase